MNNHFKIIIPYYNVEKWIKRTIRSIKAQNYKNYECILIDDMSTDNTLNIVKQEINNDKRFCMINNTEKKYALKNINDALAATQPKETDIIILLCGDDWLASPDVLNILDETYNSKKCWTTYGSYIDYPANVRGKFAKKGLTLVQEEGSYRQAEWVYSHLRTFKFKLWEKIDKKDLIFSQTNKHYKAAWDLATTYPMLEMAGKKAIYIKDILYVYNRANPLNEDKINHEIQLAEEKEIRQKLKYSSLIRLQD